MELFHNPLLNSGLYEQAKKTEGQGRGTLQLSGLIDGAKAYLVSAFASACPKVIVTYTEKRAREFMEDMKLYNRNAVYYPARDVLFYQADIRGNLLSKERLSVLKELNEDPDITVVTTFDAFMDRQIKPEILYSSMITIKVGESFAPGKIVKALVEMGYEKKYQVESPGEFASRGGILDIFPLSEDAPIRIEFWDEEIDTIRTFDVESQRSIENIEEITLYPATELVLSKDQLEKGLEAIALEGEKVSDALYKEMKTEAAFRVKSLVSEVSEGMRNGTDLALGESFLPYFYKEEASFLDYIKRVGGKIFLDEPVRAIESGRGIEAEFTESMKSRLEKGYVLSGQTKVLYSTDQVMAGFKNYGVVYLSTLDAKVAGYPATDSISMTVRGISAYNKSFELLTKDLKNYKNKKYRVLLISGSELRAKRLADDLNNEGVSAVYTDDRHRVIKEGEIVVFHGKVRRGFDFPNLNFALISESDIFGEEKKKKKKINHYEGDKIRDFAELKIGDYVVHENHGLGIYRGIEKVEVEKVTKDYLKVEYDKGGVLYVQANNLEQLQKYAGGGEGKKVKLNKLGSQEWNKTKSRVRSAVKDIAKDLVELYATREAIKGFAYSKDTVWQREFEELFPFTETEDQELAIEATKRDMESDKAMDRLICGDVGFGKTEIAIRAAFKAVQDSKQVAYLVPTTILAEQHYNTFRERMKDYPVRVDLLCRFSTPAQQKKTIADLKKGEVDIVIGTHRLLSKDVDYKNLGLLIIDEEQRFGVSHKEKIKQLKNQIDVLTLTATPIPRTLHMSLVGIRDMSVLEQAPVDRLPIQTYVLHLNIYQTPYHSNQTLSYQLNPQAHNIA